MNRNLGLDLTSEVQRRRQQHRKLPKQHSICCNSIPTLKMICCTPNSTLRFVSITESAVSSNTCSTFDSPRISFVRSLEDSSYNLSRQSAYHMSLSQSLLCLGKIPSSVKTFLSGFGKGWQKYCAIVKFEGGQRNIWKVILRTQQQCFYPTVQ